MGAPRSPPSEELATRLDIASGSEEVIPVFEERLELGVEVVETDRVRVRTETRTREAELDAVAAREHVEVERVPVERYVDRAPEVRVEGDTTVIPVVEEVVVLEKRLLLKEEVRVRKRRTEEPRTVRVPVRTQHVIVEHVEPQVASTGDPDESGTEDTRGQQIEEGRTS